MKTQKTVESPETPTVWRVLAIDDDVEVLDSYREIFSPLFNGLLSENLLHSLEKLGLSDGGEGAAVSEYLLDCASSGEEGFHMVQQATAAQKPYAVILLDMRMVPGWDGLETAEKIREVDSSAHLIIITAFMDYNLTEIRQRIGVDFEFMNKPVDRNELLELTRLHAQKWSQDILFHSYHNHLEQLVEQRTQELQRANRKVEMAMEALAKEKSEIELILESMREGVVAVDRYGNIKHVNQSLERLCGHSEQSLAGRPVQQLFSTSIAQQDFCIETLSPVSARLQSMAGDSMRVLEGWIHSSLLAALLVDEEGVILSCNGAMEGVSGYTGHALVGSNIDQLLPEEIRAQHAAEVSRFFRQPEARHMRGKRRIVLQQANGETITVEIGLLPLTIEGRSLALALIHNPHEPQPWELFRITPFGKLFIAEEQMRADWMLQHRDGSSVPTYITGAPLYEEIDGHYQFNGAVLVLHDMREIINAENERRANRAKDEFLASISHELRTPLTTIIGNSEMLSDSELSDEQQHMLRSVDVAGRGLLALINDMLDLSKIESGKFQIDEGDYDLHLLVHEIEHIFSSRISDAGLCFDIHYPAHLPHQLIGDSRRIGQIMINLLGNAIKFTNKGVIRLSIQIEASREKIIFSVEDSGIGMDPEVLDRLFQPYEQADSSISRRYGGTGLGLHISWILAELMDGSIEVESEQDKGSCFRLLLPFKPSQLPSAPLSGQGEGSIARWFTGKVLIAEDVPELQLLESRILQSMGVEVSVAKDGKEAIEIALENRFDLLLMDMQMPEIDGIEATTTLRQIGYKVPIVALTANVMQQHREQFVAAGCNGFLAKPIDRKALQDVLGQYLQERESAADAVLEQQLESTAGASLDAVVDDELMQLFVDRSKVKKQELMAALVLRNWEEVRSIAHMIKGTGASFGHPEMTQLGKEVCDLIDTQELEAVTPLVEQLAQEMMRVVCRSKQKH